MADTLRPRRDRDAGFTLVEMIVVMVLMGLVTSAIAFAAMVMLRTSGVNNDSVEASAMRRSFTTWLSRDLASAPPARRSGPNQVGVSSTQTACRAATAGRTQMVSMAWSYESGPTTRTYQGVDYWLVGTGPDPRRVVRTACTANSWGALGNTVTENDLHGEFDPVSPPIVRIEPATGNVDIVELELPLPTSATTTLRLAPKGMG